MVPTAKPLGIETTPIPGFLRIDLTVHGDNRGWFKENWQREKMVALGLPDFRPVQNNISFNDEVGVTRGIHAEPWDKFVSVATGRVFGAWVDLREGPSFGTVYTTVIDPGTAVFVPKGVGNAYQTLEPATAYTYLVNAHWSPDARYTFLNLADETVAVPWPIPLERAILSDKDRAHPRLADVTPFPAPSGPRVLVTGANGQLGRELMRQLPAAGFEATGVDLPEVSIADADQMEGFDWSSFDVVVNAAAWTNVDGAETPDGRRASWLANATGPANLARACASHGLTLVHISSEYVFDGSAAVHLEDEAPSPLGVYGQSKAGGDAAVRAAPVPHARAGVSASTRSGPATRAGAAGSAHGDAEREDGAGALPRSHEAVLGAALDLVSRDVRHGAHAGEEVARIAMAHAFVTGGDASDSERDIAVGGLASVPSALFRLGGPGPGPLSYVALGHLHSPQRVGRAGDPPMRYSGSPVAFSFSETAPKSSVLLHVHGSAVEPELIPAPVWRPVLTVEGTLEQIEAAALTADAEAFVRAVVIDPDRPTEMAERIRRAFPHALEIQHRAASGGGAHRRADVAAMDPVRVLDLFMSSAGNRPLDAAESALLADAWESALAASNREARS